jgi:hypothetical protein
MNIIICREGQNYGPYSIEQVQEWVADGTLIPATDLAWHDGMTEWLPLNVVLLQFVPAVPTITAPQLVSSSTSNPVTRPTLSAETKASPKPKSKVGCIQAFSGCVMLSFIGFVAFIVLGAIASRFGANNISDSFSASKGESFGPFYNIKTKETILTSEIDINERSEGLDITKDPGIPDEFSSNLYDLSQKFPTSTALQIVIKAQYRTAYGKLDPETFAEEINLEEVRKWSKEEYIKTHSIFFSNMFTMGEYGGEGDDSENMKSIPLPTAPGTDTTTGSSITQPTQQTSYSVGQFADLVGHYPNGSARTNVCYGTSTLDINPDGTYHMDYTLNILGEDQGAQEEGHLEKSASGILMITERDGMADESMEPRANVGARSLKVVIDQKTIDITSGKEEYKFDKSLKQPLPLSSSNDSK